MKLYSRIILPILLLFSISCKDYNKTKKGLRWSEERINRWYENQPWLVGANFITSSSINQLEFWQEETFNHELIDKELGLSASIGMNAHRVYLHNLLWEQDSLGFLNRINKFLNLSEKHGIKTMFVFFDDVWHPVPRIGKQPKPIPMVHNSGWVQSPGAKILYDTLSHNKLESYVKGVVNKFANDPRVLAWDLYNEPGITGISSHDISKERAVELYKKIGVEITDDNYSSYNLSKIDPKSIKKTYTLSLLKKTVNWVRESNPSQPITMGIYNWDTNWSPLNVLSDLDKFIISNSDIISFHEYSGKENVLKRIKELKIYNRPLICSEYIARGAGSTFEDILPIFMENKIAAFNWGLVSGKTNTIYPWKSWDSTFTEAPKLWHHDIFYPNGEPFSYEEVELIKKLTESVNGDD